MNVKTSIAKTLLTMAIPFLTVNTAFAEFSGSDLGAIPPIFKNNVLEIGAVDSADKPGAYQNVKFELTEQGKWELLDYEVGIELPDEFFNSVELITTDTSPMQVFLKISIPSLCPAGNLTQIRHSLIDNTFNVSVYYQPSLEDPTTISCAAVIASPRIIPLSVYDLPEGEYSYNVNGGLFSGSFNLQNNTISPEEIQ